MAIICISGNPSTGMSLSCPPVGFDPVPPSSTTPGAGVPRAGIRLSNLDLNDKLVKRGRFVSYHGVRGVVVAVRRGRCFVDYLHITGRKTGSGEWHKCESLQVVA